ncbi:uncharacterized protein LOC127241285 [Andrographis paniculata]|uniref:uncharacterized protein LOC127241285 n=1 Tax=Andrographis paniculata TaxID=175694 RepID=UPI0021E816E1|nr:uncharacterized protein LOC127241285 [Andrographis paniculata]XP_051116185.1 uncharacterized protein LOC127241285 [Andrographis paniculata]
METRKPEIRQLLKDKRFWFASALIVWAAALQGHMMWMQKQDSFKEKFRYLNSETSSDETSEGRQ